jgi:asparagine synthase (glutamine-hydrolysing)
LIEDLDQLIWYMDEPFGSTSQFSQWSVFEGAANAGLKVMLDGQGSDEMLAGYGGNDVALYAGLYRKRDIFNILKNYHGFKRELGYAPKGQLIHAFGRTYPIFNKFLPPGNYQIPTWVNAGSYSSGYQPPKTLSLQEEMIHQTTVSSLPALLRYEDRNSMAFSIESRVPFLDYHLVEFLLGLPESYVYHKGIRKVILRQALSSLVPESILGRKDKMGFVTPEEVWLKEEKKDWFMDQVQQAVEISGEWIKEKEAVKMTRHIMDGRSPFTFEPWRVLCFGRWLKQMNA